MIAFGADLLVLTADEFAQARARGREFLEAGEETPAPAAEPQLLDAGGLEVATGVPARWWMDQARVHRVPHLRVGKRVRFCLAEVLACEAVRRRGVHGLPIRGGRASA